MAKDKVLTASKLHVIQKSECHKNIIFILRIRPVLLILTKERRMYDSILLEIYVRFTLSLNKKKMIITWTTDFIYHAENEFSLHFTNLVFRKH